MRWSCATLVVLILFTAVCTGTDFQRIAFIDPYDYLVSLNDDGLWDTTGTSPELYYAQLDSLGFTLATTRADTLSTSNPYGIKILGQSGMKGYDSGQDSDSTLYELVHRAQAVLAEAEDTDTNDGCWWTYGTEGDFLTDPETGYPIARLFDPNVDVADTVMLSHGEKFRWQRARVDVSGYTRCRFRMMAWDTATTDTICDIWVGFSGPSTWEVEHYGYRGTDFSTPGAWKTFQSYPLYVKGDQPSYIKVYWRGTDSLAVDRMDIVDLFAMNLDNVSDGQLDTTFIDFYASIDTSGLKRFYPSDEPYPCGFWSLKLFDDCAATHGSGARVMTAIQTDGHVPIYIYDMEPLEVARWRRRMRCALVVGGSIACGQIPA